MSPRPRFFPGTVSLLVLATIFVTEYLIMLALPWFLPPKCPVFLEAVVDSMALITVLSPLVWWTVLRPQREVIQLRNRFLLDLFAHIEADKRRTAHELHDGVGQPLSLLISGLRSAGAVPADSALADRDARLLDLAQTALQDVKRLSRGLRPSLLDDFGLAPAIERLVAQVRDHHAIDLTLELTQVTDQRFPESVETAVFRIVQESLANVVKHAGAQTASVVVIARDGLLTVEVTDDGCGARVPDLQATGSGHLGLIGMRERVGLLGGHFAIVSQPGQGTQISATIPIKA